MMYIYIITMWSYNYDFLINGFINGVVNPVRILDWHKLPIPFLYFKGFLWEWYGNGGPTGGISLDSIKQEASKSHQILNGQGATRYKSS